MTDADITWVCCPDGIRDGSLRISVVAVPRLAPSGTLGNFEALVDWPARLTGARWMFGLGTGAAEVEADVVGELPSSGLWAAVFPATTPVRAFGSARDRTGHRPVLSYPAAQVAATLRDRYRDAALRTQDHHLQPGAVLRPQFDLRPLQEFEEGVRAGVVAAGLQISELEGEETGFVEVTSTHQAGATPVGKAYAMQQPAGPATEVDDEAEAVDFHGALSLLGDHPVLMRRLGLVVDLSVPIDAVDDSVTSVRLAQSGSLPGDVVHRFPATRVLLDVAAGTFAAEAVDPALSSGVWPVDRPEYILESLDLDTAVRKAVAMASGPDPAGPESSTPPSLRNDGIALVHTGRARTLVEKVTRARSRRTAVVNTVSGAVADQADLHAEDLLRGYRVDIWDDASRSFRSLHARDVRYTVDGFGALPSADGRFRDEGFFQDSLTGDAALYIHERLVTWRGWSLSVPRPDARRLAPAPATVPKELAAVHTHVSAQVPPGTLPRLRFGTGYRMRLRTVDLAGNSALLGAAPDVATPELMYLRYDPVGPPVLAPTGATAEFGAGESLHRLVVRAPAPGPDGAIVIGGDGPPPAERLLLPPKGLRALAEQHGVLDDALGSPDPSRRGAVLAELRRAEAVLTLPVGEFAPYLPDPQASGIAFEGLPGVPPGEVFAVPFAEESTWADVRPIRLRVRGPDPFGEPSEVPPSFDNATGILEVVVAEGAIHRVRVSSMLRHPDAMALLRDLHEHTDPVLMDEVVRRVNTGQHPMFTPYVELELVHAVPVPTTPRFDTPLEPLLAVGQASVGFRAVLAVDPVTTDAIALHARWTEPVADASGPAGAEVRSEQVLSVRVPPDGLTPISGDPLGRHELVLDTEAQGLPRHQLPDTGFRTVSYRPVATARFADCYPTASTGSAEGPAATLAVPNVVAPPPPVVHSVVPSQVVLPPQVDSSGEVFEAVFAGMADPDTLPPEPGWKRTTQRRQGGGIRVYLRPPWFVTGAEESLGVVLVGPEFSLAPVPGVPDDVWAHDGRNPLTQWFSQVGQDPIRRSGRVTALVRDSFVNVTHERALSAVPDALGADGAGVQMPATILGHVPHFEESSGLWYADIRLNVGRAYMPFLRLAVCRFQPHSLDESVSLSRISAIDILQPLPDRTLTLLRHQQDPEITVTLWGPSYRDTDPDTAPRVTARVFSANPAGGTLDGARWRPVAEVAELELVRDQGRGFWTAKTQVPPQQPGRVLRVLVVEREQLGSPVGLNASRIVHVGTIDL